MASRGGGWTRPGSAASTRGGGTTPPPGRYEAEDATISQGIFENSHAGYCGTGYVNGDNAAGSYLQWSVTAASAGTATIKLGYANGDDDEPAVDDRGQRHDGVRPAGPSRHRHLGHLGHPTPSPRR